MNLDLISLSSDEAPNGKHEQQLIPEAKLVDEKYEKQKRKQ